MLNLYCYHSPISSSVGFQEAGWSVSNGHCAVMEETYASKEIWQMLHSGGYEAICMDTGRDTRAFIVRGVSVQQGMQSGWQLNFAFEADSEDDSPWKDLTAAYLNDCTSFAKKFAALFSVTYDNGEHYKIDGKGFLELIHESTGNMDSLQRYVEETFSGKENLVSFVQKLREPHRNDSVGIFLLVPTVTVDYFMRCNSEKNLPSPECCISKEQWDALLAHEEYPKVSVTFQKTEPHTESKYSFSLSDAAILGGGLAAAALVVFGFQRTRKKRQRRRRR